MITLKRNEVDLLLHLAGATGADTWFDLDYDGNFKDTEGVAKSFTEGVEHLIEGAVESDYVLQDLSEEDKIVLIEIMLKLL